MRPKTIAIVFTAGFLVLCGVLILQSSGLCLTRECKAQGSETAEMPDVQAPQTAPEPPAMTAGDGFADRLAKLSAVQGERQGAVLGELYDTIERWSDPEKYKFRIELTAKGAAIERVQLSEFDNRFQEERGPLTLLFGLENQRMLYTLATPSLWVAPAAGEFGSRAFPLSALNWELREQDENHAVYEATLGIVENNELVKPMLRLRKTYRIEPGQYDLDMRLAIENLTGRDLKTRLVFQGPCGLSREDIQRDLRKVMASYRADGEIISVSLDTEAIRKATRKDPKKLKLTPKPSDAPFVWGAVSNKYFTAIVRPTEQAEVFAFGQASLHELPGEKSGRPDETASFTLQTAPITLAGDGEQSRSELGMSVYLGPKDRSIFENNETYRALAYFHTIDFRSCCCPTSIIAPLAFAIMWFMKTVYTLMGPVGNYGVVIIVLVFLVRLLMHPVTKHQQVSMMKMQKLGPQLQEVQKKYKGSPAELQRAMGEVYAEAGMTQFTPVFSMMLPMLIQMPVWIALWTSVYTSVDLRGAGFLPFWITDLSAPDALIHFGRFSFTIPLVGLRIESLNALPILMGVVMYLQQKFMAPTRTTQVSPEMAQQQKIMAVMLPLMFPLFLYNGPSGVNLYIMSSIGAGLVEQLVIRKHLKEREEEEQRPLVPTTKKIGKVKKKKPKPFFRENR